MAQTIINFQGLNTSFRSELVVDNVRFSVGADSPNAQIRIFSAFDERTTYIGALNPSGTGSDRNTLVVEFPIPISNLNFATVGVDDPGVAAFATVYSGDRVIAQSVEVSHNLSGPVKVEQAALSALTGITRLELKSDDPAGTGYDDFTFTSGALLFLDFDKSIPRDFFVKTMSFFGSKEIVAHRSGSEPTGFFTEHQKSLIVSGVQAIFDRSGIAITVTDEEPVTGPYHSVRFSQPLPFYDSDGEGSETRLLGKAYEGVDRYNKNNDDIVAVFLDGSQPLNLVVETIAHEVAHSFGARHVNPEIGPSSEVLDYQRSPIPKFVDSPTRIIEPPEDGETASLFSPTHNPTYHIRRYVVGESDEALRAEGIVPGTYDVGTFKSILYTFGFDSLSVPLIELSVVFVGESDRVEGGANDGFGAISMIAPVVNSGDEIQFEIPEGVEFYVVASSSNSEVVDVAVNFGQPSENLFTLVAGEQLPHSARVIHRSSPEEVGVQIGVVENISTEEEIVDSGTAPVNAPPVAVDDNFSINEKDVLLGSVLADNGNGLDEDLDGDDLIVSLISGTSYGELILSEDGSFKYEAVGEVFDLAAAGDVIEQSFTYQIDDGNGGMDQATATISVKVLHNIGNGVLSRVEFQEVTGRDNAVTTVDSVEVGVQQLRWLDRQVEIDAAGLTIGADDGLRWSPDFVSTIGNGIGVWSWSFFRDGFFGEDRKTFDNDEILSFLLDDSTGLGNALDVSIEFATIQGTGQVSLALYNGDLEIDNALLTVQDGAVYYDPSGDQTFDRVDVGVVGGLDLTIGSIAFQRLDADAFMVA